MYPSSLTIQLDEPQSIVIVSSTLGTLTNYGSCDAIDRPSILLPPCGESLVGLVFMDRFSTLAAFQRKVPPIALLSSSLVKGATAYQLWTNEVRYFMPLTLMTSYCFIFVPRTVARPCQRYLRKGELSRFRLGRELFWTVCRAHFLSRSSHDLYLLVVHFRITCPPAVTSPSPPLPSLLHRKRLT